MKLLKQNKKRLIKSSSCLLKRGKRSESHILLECKNHIMSILETKYKKQN